MSLRQLIEEESGDLSMSRCGIVFTLALILFTVGCDLYLVLGTTLIVRVPNQVYQIETAMFGGFSLWAMGKGIAANAGPMFGAIGAALGGATRDAITARRKEGKDFDAEATP